MLIAIDIGNTNVVLGFFLKGKLIQDRRISSALHRTEDEIWIMLKHFLDQMKISPESIQGIVIASVVPELSEIFLRMIKKNLKVTPLFVNGKLDLGFTIPYNDPMKLGADRICGIFAALKKFGGPAIIVDFGTATTYDVITSKGEYLGGVIAPGLETSALGLFSKTSKLPKTEMRFPESIVGKDTATAIQSGVMYGAVDAFEGMVKRLRRVVGKYATVIATGGYAQLVAEMTSEIKYMEPDLILEGARLIHERIGKKTKK